MKHLFLFSLLIFPIYTFAQMGVNFHQSNIPFVGINYQINNRLRPELRIGTDNYFEDLSVEGVLMYDVVKKNDYEIYGGLGYRTYNFSGLVIPVGVNVYPLEVKQFGFHIELTPIIGDFSLLRGSWGIRYRFSKKEQK